MHVQIPVSQVYLQAAKAVSRRVHQTEQIVEVAKVACAVDHEADVCETVYSRNWNFFEKLFGDRLREKIHALDV